MSDLLKPLFWKIYNKIEKEEMWPKKVIGSSLVYVEKTQKYFLLGGNFNAYENAIKNIELNKEILWAVDQNIENFSKYDNKKMKYITELVSNSSKNPKEIDIYSFDLYPERKWQKISPIGRVPSARSFQRCISYENLIFCFGGVVLGSKGENASVNELYVFNIDNYKWTLINIKKSPNDRCDFTWLKLEKVAIFYGGASSPDENYHDDMWTFNYKDFEYINENTSKDIEKDLWREIKQTGTKPGKVRGYAMEYSQIDDKIYLHGGHDSRGNIKPDLFRFDMKTNTWDIVRTKGKSPDKRSYHEMSLINKNHFIIFGGVRGVFTRFDLMYNDIYLYNINDAIWVSPIIGGIQPSPRFGFSFCNNYNFGKIEVLILGGITEETDKVGKNNINSLKLYSLTENDYEPTHYWTITDINYKEGENDENFLLQCQKKIFEYKGRIDTLEIDISNKEINTEEMRVQIEDMKKNFYKSHGFIDDHTQSLDDQVEQLEYQTETMKESLNKFDKIITDNKLKLKYVMQRKVEKTMEFFCCNQELFIMYYDSMMKIMQSKFYFIKLDCQGNEVNNLFPKNSLNAIKSKYGDRLMNMKNKLENLNAKEELIMAELHGYKKIEKNVDELFKEEKEQYKITEDSLGDA